MIRDDHTLVTCGQQLGSGGEGSIYRLLEDPNLVAKVYHKLTPEQGDKVKMMLVNRPKDYTRDQGHYSLAWPEPNGRLFNAHDKFVGFVMPYIDFSTSYPLLKLYNPQDRKQVLPTFTWQYLLRTAKNLAVVVDSLHQRGYVVGDLNESNILVSGGAQVTFVDCDSMQVPRRIRGYF